MKKRVSEIIALFLSLLVLAGCTGQGNVPSEYVAVYSDAAFFIEWAETDNKLTGQLQEGRLGPGSQSFSDWLNGKKNNTLAVTSENYSFNGVFNRGDKTVINGGDISILLSNGTTMTGIVNQKMLLLSYPASDGTIQTKDFYLGYLEDGTLVGKAARSPENALGFKTGNWSFWAMVFKVTEKEPAFGNPEWAFFDEAFKPAE